MNILPGLAGFVLLLAACSPSPDALGAVEQPPSAGLRRPVDLERTLSSVRLEPPTDKELAAGKPLVELFTSQGCSSCPPADRLLGRLGDEVVSVAFHVDSWNHIGWTDPFSRHRWSARQSAIGQRLGGDRMYTPQAVIDGRWEGVGSDERWLRRALSERSRLGLETSPAHLSVEVSPRGQLTEVDLEVASSRAGAVWLAVTGSNYETPVRSGENARLSLRNDHVVLTLERIGDVTAGERRRWKVDVGGVVSGGDAAVVWVATGDGFVLGAARRAIESAGRAPAPVH
jgi:hypothetical protein